MDILFKDFEKRFFTPPVQGKRRMTDKDVLREMAETWVDSGGESSGLTDEYVMMLRAEIRRVERGEA
jgi:hypothetical protein